MDEIQKVPFSIDLAESSVCDIVLKTIRFQFVSDSVESDRCGCNTFFVNGKINNPVHRNSEHLK
ncbi:hypothetical protein PMAYCL1PPCAC_08583, partial [Pristionchus mayeri]